jgi:hypothetical protein
MSPVEPETNNDYAGDDQQKFTLTKSTVMRLMVWPLIT